MIIEKNETQNNFFARQELISWWDQTTLRSAKVLVIGAGALGNEVLKNLALIGIGQTIIIDFDIIEESNLSRAVLFRMVDAGNKARKVEVAAKRAQELNPNAESSVVPIHGDVVWETGLGLFRHADIVLGCLDNLEARLKVNENCWLVDTSWIDGGIWEISGSVSAFDSSAEKACYHCSITESDLKQANTRYSCSSATIRTKIESGQEPTTQLASATIAALQSQEAVKSLHKLELFAGQQLVFNGQSHFYTNRGFSPITLNELAINPECLVHNETKISHIVELPSACANKTTIQELLELVEAHCEMKRLTLISDREFVTTGRCPFECGFEKEFNKPLFKITDIEATCPNCTIECPICHQESKGSPYCSNCGQEDLNQLHLERVYQFGPLEPASTSSLGLTLASIGIPEFHILCIKDHLWQTACWVELTGDKHKYWK